MPRAADDRRCSPWGTVDRRMRVKASLSFSPVSYGPADFRTWAGIRAMSRFSIQSAGGWYAVVCWQRRSPAISIISISSSSDCISIGISISIGSSIGISIGIGSSSDWSARHWPVNSDDGQQQVLKCPWTSPTRFHRRRLRGHAPSGASFAVLVGASIPPAARCVSWPRRCPLAYARGDPRSRYPAASPCLGLLG